MILFGKSRISQFWFRFPFSPFNLLRRLPSFHRWRVIFYKSRILFFFQNDIKSPGRRFKNRNRPAKTRTNFEGKNLDPHVFQEKQRKYFSNAGFIFSINPFRPYTSKTLFDGNLCWKVSIWKSVWVFHGISSLKRPVLRGKIF